MGTKQAIYHNVEDCRGSEEGASEGVSGKEGVEKLTEEDEKKLEDWKGKLRVWKLGEAVVKQQIAVLFLTPSL